MYRILLAVFTFIALTTNAIAGDDITIKVAQSGDYASSNMHASSLSTVTIPAGENFNIKYDFTINAKDDEQSAIDCIIKIPKYLNAKLTSSQGIQALATEENGEVPALTVYDSDDEMFKICEFLIPQKKDGTSFAEFQVNVDERFVGENFPIEIKFSHLRPPFFVRHGTKFGIAAGIAAGIIVGVATFNPATGAVAGAAAGTATATATAGGLTLVGAVAAGTGTAAAISVGSAFVSYESMQKTLQEMKNKYESMPLNDSYTKYSLQVREN